MSDTTLTEKQESLLHRYLDRECCAAERAEVEQLVTESPAARESLARLEATSSFVRASFEHACHNRVDLWEGICRRIENEESAALYMGERRSVEPRASKVGRFLNWIGLNENRFIWGGVAGSVGAACLAFAVFQNVPGVFSPGTISPGDNSFADANISGGGLSGGGEGPLRLASFRDDEAELPKVHGRPRIIEPAGLQLDLVRSSGRPKVIRNTEDRSPVIWVTRSPLVVNAGRVQPAMRTPLVLGERYPNAITVSEYSGVGR